MQQSLLTQLSICKLSNIKPNFAELAREYNLDWRTVKKYYDGYEGKPKHRSKPSKLDPYLDIIKQKLSIRGVTARAVYEFILDEKDSNIGTYSNFNKYIKSKGLKPVKTPKGHPRFETEPGVQAQVDWKEDISIANRYGEIFTWYIVIDSFNWSFAIYIFLSINLLSSAVDYGCCNLYTNQCDCGFVFLLVALTTSERFSPHLAFQ